MEIINTIESGFSVLTVISLIFIGFAGILSLIAFFVSDDFNPFPLLAFAVSALLFVGIYSEASGPDRYEVILTDPDAVIDAREYEIIEQRGDIYVIVRNER